MPMNYKPTPYDPSMGDLSGYLQRELERISVAIREVESVTFAQFTAPPPKNPKPNERLVAYFEFDNQPGPYYWDGTDWKRLVGV